MEIQNRKIALENESDVATQGNLLDTLLILKEKENLTDEDILGHVNTIIGASYETTATAMLLILLEIGSHHDVQEKLYQEISEILEDREITKDDMPKMVYMNAVVKECLRLYPPAPVYAKKIHRDINILDYTLEAGSLCLIGIYGINRLPIWGKDADQFRPERWLEPNSLPPNPNAYATFSLGKRNCIGRQYSMMSIKTALAHIVRRYRVKADINKLVLKFQIILKPVSGHEISLELRE